jgi:hypothetical protein
VKYAYDISHGFGDQQIVLIKRYLKLIWLENYCEIFIFNQQYIMLLYFFLGGGEASYFMSTLVLGGYYFAKYNWDKCFFLPFLFINMVVLKFLKLICMWNIHCIVLDRGTLTSGLAEYVISLTTLYNIIFWRWLYTCKGDQIIKHSQLFVLQPHTWMSSSAPADCIGCSCSTCWGCLAYYQPYPAFNPS